MADADLSMEASIDITKLKVAELKRELKERGLNVSGNKLELQERLREALQGGDQGLESGGEVEDETVEDYVLEDDDLADDSKVSVTIDSCLQEEVELATPPILNESLPSLSEKENKNHLNKTTIDRSSLNTSTQEETIPSKDVTKLSAAEKLEIRAKRFNVPLSEDAKKQARAERFGSVTVKRSSGSALVVGSSNGSSDALMKRAERFGLPVAKPGQKPDTETLLKRKERFGPATKDQELEEKKRKRAERFNIV